MKYAHRILAAAGVLALALGAAAVQAQGAAGSVPGAQVAPAAQSGAGTRNTAAAQDVQLARVDRRFLQDAMHSGMFEVQAAQLAAAKATDLQVKGYASMLVDHHTAANNELVRIAAALQVELPAAPRRALRRGIERLGKKSDAEFDRGFVREVGLKAHERDIRMFEKAAKRVRHAEVKAFIDKTLPALRDHLAAAQKLPQSASKG